MNASIDLKKGTVGMYAAKGDMASCTLIHDSPANQGHIEVVLTENFICLGAGELIKIPRRHFTPCDSYIETDEQRSLREAVRS